MTDKNTPIVRYTSLAQCLAAQIAEATAAAQAEAQREIGPAEAELAEARDDLVRAEARLDRAARNVRELQDLLGNVAQDDIIMTQTEVDSHNGEAGYDDRVETMVFGHSRNSNPSEDNLK